MRTMFCFSEFERDTIVERTQKGKAIARRDKNYREGRKQVSVDMVLLESLSLLQRIGKITAAEVAKQLGITVPNITSCAKRLTGRMFAMDNRLYCLKCDRECEFE